MTKQIKQLYKYTKAETAILILQNQNFQFSTNKELNDELDLNQPVSFLDMDSKSFKKRFLNKLKEVLKGNEVLYHNNLSEFYLDLINDTRNYCSSIDKDMKNKHIDKLFVNLRYKLILDKVYQTLNKQIKDETFALLNKTRIFCTTLNYDSGYMWEKYADNGRGVIFALDLEKGTFPFSQPKAVKYTNKPISFFESPDEIIEYSLGLRKELNMIKEVRRIQSTKTKDWSKEKEYRFILNCFDDAKLHEWRFHHFEQEFIPEIYLGYNMKTDMKEKIMGLLKSFDKVKIFQTEVSPANNDLKFLPIN